MDGPTNGRERGPSHGAALWDLDMGLPLSFSGAGRPSEAQPSAARAGTMPAPPGRAGVSGASLLRA